MSTLFKCIFHDFLDDFDLLRKYVDTVNFKGELNPDDGVFYPNISFDIPEKYRIEVVDKLGGFFGVELKNVKMFMRLSLNGDNPPHAAHNDQVMGQYGFMVYLNRFEDCKGGTSFVKHNDGSMEFSTTEADQLTWKRDTNKREMWERTDTVSMTPNKAVLFNSGFTHWAEMPHSFGTSAADGRLLLICFFDL